MLVQLEGERSSPTKEETTDKKLNEIKKKSVALILQNKK